MGLQQSTKDDASVLRCQTFISSEAMLQQKVEYIHQNPVKRSYVDDPAHWRYSSYRSYLGEPGLLEVTLLD